MLLKGIPLESVWLLIYLSLNLYTFIEVEEIHSEKELLKNGPPHWMCLHIGMVVLTVDMRGQMYLGGAVVSRVSK